MIGKRNVKIPKIGALKVLLGLNRFIDNSADHFKKLLQENDGLLQFYGYTYGWIYLTDRPDLMRYILQKNHKNYRHTAKIKKELKKQVGIGLFTSDGEYWLKQRKAIQPIFHIERLQGLSLAMVNEIDNYISNDLDDLSNNQKEFDLAHVMTDLGFKVLSRALFGQEIDQNNLAFIKKSFRESQFFVANVTKKPYVKILYQLNGTYKRTRKSKVLSDSIIKDVIDKRKASSQKGHDLLNMLLATKYEDGTGMPDTQLLNESRLLFSAAHGTTAMVLSWTLYLIATHPQVESKLYNSIMEVLPERNPSFSDLPRLIYALQVVEESMRLYPPAYVIDRELINDDNFEGIKLKKGRPILCSIHGIHRNPKYWKKPDTFDPERFSAANKEKQTPYSYVPFGEGPRFCIGNNFALMEIQFIIAMIIKKFRIHVTTNQKIEIESLLTLVPKGGIPVKLKKR